MLQIFAGRAAAQLALRLIGPASLFLAGFGAAVALEHKAPWGLQAKRRAAEAEAADWRGATETWEANAKAWEASFRKAEAYRAQEHAAAVAAVNQAQAACDARVAQARKSALAIHNLVTKEVPRDPQGCPVRQLVDPRELRNAIGAPPRPGR